jgi:hypothetical protein
MMMCADWRCVALVLEWAMEDFKLINVEYNVFVHIAVFVSK